MRKFENQYISQLFQSDIRAMTRECTRLEGINMAQGVCDLPTPPEIVEATKNAIDQDLSIYAPVEGLLPLREAIAAKLERDNGLKADAEKEITVTCGATGAFATALKALFNAGDGLVLFEPFYGYHLNEALLNGLKVDFVPFNGENFKITEEGLRSAVKDHTRAIVLCSPGNPSGHMLTEEEIKIVAKVANEKDLLVFSDEIYEYFKYDGREHLSPANFPELKDRTITVMGLSKTFSITGWRLGYVIAPEEWTQKIRVVNDLLYVCAPTPLQHGVLKGFELPTAYYQELITEFQDKRDRFCDALDSAGMKPFVPEGAYYVLADIEHWGFDDSKEASMKFLEKTRIGTVPGKAFFESAASKKFIRFCYAIEEEPLNEVCKRLKEFKGEF